MPKIPAPIVKMPNKKPNYDVAEICAYILLLIVFLIILATGGCRKPSQINDKQYAKNLMLLDFSTSGLNESDKQKVEAAIKAAYKPFNLLITTDTTISFQNRQRVIITVNNEFYGNSSAGFSYIGSLFFTDGVPCYVFSKLLNYNVTQIIYSSVHEIGHTIGLKHQSVYDSACNFINEYNRGNSKEAPWMGYVAYGLKGKWWIGTSRDGCNYIQYDSLFLSQRLQ